MNDTRNYYRTGWAMTSNRVIWPFIFENEESVNITINH